jgi:hypothetical protein
MKKYLVPGALAVAFAVPALAGGGDDFPYYLAKQVGSEYAACEIMNSEPNPSTHKVISRHKTEAEARAAMASTKDCGVPSPGD